MTMILSWAGIILSLAGIAFVVANISKYADQLGSLRFGGVQIFILVLMALIYCFANLFLAAAWRALLEHTGSKKTLPWAVRIFGISQLAKYVPGNFLHLAGRQAMGMSGGARTVDMAKSAAWELGTIAFTASLFAILLAPFLAASLSNFHAMGIFVAALASVGFIVRKRLSIFIVQAVFWYAGFFLVSGLIFVAMLILLNAGYDNLVVIAPGIIGAYVVAWLAGFVTPGAPAGVGVREVVLFTVLQSVVGHADLLAAIVLSRVVTTAGDLLFYLFALFIKDDR
jgi:glycosyltransferase 2 family protein